MRVLAVACALWLFLAPDVLADEVAAPGSETAADLEWRVRSRPDAFVRPAPLRVFPCCPDPFQIARGPAEVRDQFTLAQVRLTLPSVAPDVLSRGRWLVRLHADVGNDFGFSQTGAAESPTSDRRFLVDAERRSLEAEVRRGFGRGFDAGLRVPVRWRGGGFLDGMIEWWHDRWGLSNNSRQEFYQDVYRVQGRDAAFNQISWDEEGWGLGNAEVDVRWEFLRPAARNGWRAAVIGRAGLPTGTGPYETSSVDLGLQVVGAKQLHRRLDVYGGVGGTWFSEDDVEGIVYETWRGAGFLAVEWRPAAYMSLFLQTDVSSRLVSNLVDYPGVQWYLHAGIKVDLGCGWRLTGGLTENLADQQSTSDVDFWGSLEVVF